MPVYSTTVKIPRPIYLGSEEWSINDLNEVTILFGRNGSGKSLMLRSWRDMSLDSVHYVAPERTGEMDLQPQYMREELEPTGRKNASSRNFMPEYRRRIIARIQAYFMSRGNYRGDGKAPGSPEAIETLLTSLLSDFELSLSGSATLPYRLVRLETGAEVSNVDQMSSGEAQLLTIGLDILTIASIWEVNQQATRVLLIDEPDPHIHPDLQVRFADFIFGVAKHYKLQVVVATHSISLVAALGQFGGDRTSVIYVNRKVASYRAQRFGSVQKELSACLGGNVLMGPLFGVPILLVEGDDDYRIWSQVPRHHVAAFSVIPSNGEEIKQYQKALEQIFSSLRDTDHTASGYALIDADKGMPSPTAANPQKHIRFIQLACYESENLYLTDEVLSDIGTTWDLAKLRVASEASNYGNKSAILSRAATWDRMKDDIKSVISELSMILDPKHVHWTLRVGRAIGKTRPTGQLSTFLGANVVGALW
jgi:ABC-type branched-subunit amino acid transport system ATPase component